MHVMSGNKCILVTLFLWISACAASPQYMVVPSKEVVSNHAIDSYPSIEKSFNHMTRALDEKNSVIYLQSFGGGGVGVGVLFGPLGVAANIAAIQRNTEEDVALLHGKFKLDPMAILVHVSNGFRDVILSDSKNKAVRISPFINIVKTENEQLLVGCSIIVDYRPAGTEWEGKYVYQAPVKLEKNEVAKGLPETQTKELEAHLSTGFAELLRLYLDDANGRLASTRDLRFKSAFVSPRWVFEMPGQELQSTDERVNIRSVGAVYSLPRTFVQFSM